MLYSKQDVEHISKGIEVILTTPEKIKSLVVFFGDLNNIKQRAKITPFKNSSKDFRLTIDKPNFKERAFIKLCKKAKTHPKRFWIN